MGWLYLCKTRSAGWDGCTCVRQGVQHGEGPYILAMSPAPGVPTVLDTFPNLANRKNKIKTFHFFDSVNDFLSDSLKLIVSAHLRGNHGSNTGSGSRSRSRLYGKFDGNLQLNTMR
jgi:hypothetical protein